MRFRFLVLLLFLLSSPAIGQSAFHGLISDYSLQPPENTVLPEISGDVDIPNTITVDDGTWNNSPTSFAYQWLRNGVDISGETTDSYTTSAPDNGAILTVRVTATNAAGSTNIVSTAFLPGEGFFIPTDVVGSDENTEWTDWSTINSITDAGDHINLLDNNSTEDAQTRMRTLGYTFTDDMMIRHTVEIVSLNDTQSWNPSDLDEVPILASGTGDNPLNRVGFSFPIVHEFLDIRVQIWFQKAQDYGTSGNVEVWTVINDLSSPGNFKFKRLHSGPEVPIGTPFSFAVHYKLVSMTEYLVDMYVGSSVILSNHLAGMNSGLGAGYGSLVYQIKGTAAEPVEVNCYKIEMFDLSINTITYVGQGITPADDGANATNSISIPVSSFSGAITGDLLFAVFGDRQTAGVPTYTMTNAAGQTWTRIDGTVSSIVMFWCRYNGSFSGATNIVFNSTTNTCTSALVFQFTPETPTSTWATDVSLSEGITSSSLLHSAPGMTVGNYNTISFAVFLASSRRNMTWFGPAWKTVTSRQYRNTSGSDRTYGVAYKVMNTPGDTELVGNLVTGTATQLAYFLFTLRQQ